MLIKFGEPNSSHVGFSSMRGDDAKKVCPNIQLIQVPVARGKADLNLYRNAGSEVCWAQKKSFVTFLSVFRVFLFFSHSECREKLFIQFYG